jgi:tetratricopeptide (TPR) repeat protein
VVPTELTASEWFVGRADELRRVDRVCDAARHGRGGLVVVSGEPGIGKTRFCEEAGIRAERAGLTVAVARCWGEGGAPPLWPWQPILSDLCGADKAQLLHSAPGTQAEDVDRFVRFTAVTDAIAEACVRNPACIVIDDIHAADAGALLLARFVTRSLPQLPLVLILSRRRGVPAADTLESRILDELEDEASPIALRRFDIDEATAFLRSQGLLDLPTDVVLAILRVTGGNPLFLRRIAALGAPDSRGELPGGLRVAIDEALSRLGADSRDVLRASAVLGLSPTFADAAAVAQTDAASVLGAVAEAARAGLVTEGADGFSFTHDLVRSALEEDLAPAERLDVHARAASMLASDGRGTTTENLARRAHHALAAAPRSLDDAHLAARACRTAAAAMIRSFGYERADELLSAAVDLHTPSLLGAAPPNLLVDWAQTALLRGRLGEARVRFDRAATAAQEAGEPELFAEAALGLGGHWLYEHRAPTERARVLGLQRAALAGLPSVATPLMSRLTARLAAEDTYDGGSIEAVRNALELARGCGDSRALAEALSLYHHVLLAPEYAQRRLEVADELLQTAAVAGHGVLALMGLYWRTVDLFHLGDERAVRSLEDLRERADALACQDIAYLVDAMDVMLLMRGGRLAEAEAAAGRCYELGEAVGDADAVGFYGAHMLVVRWMQGRGAEVVDAADEVVDSPTLIPGEFAFRAAAAGIAAEAGQHERARRTLAQLTRQGLEALPRSSNWLAGMFALVEVAATLEDTDIARQTYDLLSPFADLPVTVAAAVACLGSIQRSLGRAALTFGDRDRAVRHLERAITANRRLQNRPLTTITRADLATALAVRGRDDDRARAGTLLQQAVAEAQDMGMAARADAWREALATLDLPSGTDLGRSGAVATQTLDARRGLICRQGRAWRVELGDRRVLVADRVGMSYLAELLSHPGEPISATALAGEGGVATHAMSDRAAGDAGVALARELSTELAEAEANNDLGRAEHLRIQLDAVLDQLDAGSPSAGGSAQAARRHERARTSVRKAIMRAIEEIDAADPQIAEPLRAGIRTGTVCSYTPPSAHLIEWSVRRSPEPR